MTDPTQECREAVARLVDPMAFDHRYVRPRSPGWADRKARRLGAAVSKADAILSALDALSPKGTDRSWIDGEPRGCPTPGACSCPTPQPTDEAVRGLVEQLEAVQGDDHERNCEGRCYTCTCGYDASKDDILTEAAALIRSQSAEIDEYRQRETDVGAAIGTTAYMDPPDGGDMSLAEQVRRMAAEIARLQALPGEVESGWLIERVGKPMWWGPVCLWTSDASKALRMARREDAEALRRFHCLPDDVAFVSEHIWAAAPCPTTEEGA